jgi:primosomal protein N' (replication factor Y)
MNISVCLPISLNRDFDYILPPDLEDKAAFGTRIKVPFGKSVQEGFITALNTKPKLPKNIKLKEVIEVVNSQVYYGAELKELADFIVKNYANTLGQTLNVLLPSMINDKLLAKYSARNDFNLPLFYEPGPKTEAQINAIKTAENNFATLFWGPAFSGKTQAALTLAHKTLNEGKQVLLLVPDIISSAELIKTVQEKFGQQNICLWHSKVALSQRKQSLADILNGKPCLVIGTRSACLLPFKNLGLSIIYKEEDKGFKQEDSLPYYHAREVILKRAEITKSKVILLSATPSLETLYKLENKQIAHYNFKEPLPKFNNPILLIHTQNKGQKSKYICDDLLEEINKNLLKNKQTLLIINRLGYSGAVSCLNCKTLLKCKKCGALLTMQTDKNGEFLLCPKCHAKESLDQKCPKCKNEIFRPVGAGTQAVQKDLERIFPSARILRLDSQTLKTKQDQGFFVQEALYTKQADIVLGTPLLLNTALEAKDITLGAILDGDSQLSSPDFRANEHFAQILFNFMGRLKRNKNSKLFIQLKGKELFDFSILKGNNYTRFAKQELEFRKEFFYPPYTKLIKLVIIAKTKKDLDNYTKIIKESIDNAYSAFMQVQGPLRSGRQQDKSFEQYLLIKTKDETMLEGFLKNLNENKIFKKVILKIVADPYNFM